MAAESACPGEGELQGYVAGSLAGETTTEIEAHLATCEGCRSRIDGMRTGTDSPSSGGPSSSEGGKSSIWTKTTQAAPTSADARETEEALADIQIMLQPSTETQFLGRVGVYEISSVLGRGGMGIVFKAFDTALHRPVAIKVLSPQLATSPRARRRFMREARAVAGINHPNVVTIHSVDEQGGLPYLVMEFVSGRTLRERLKITPPLDHLSVVRISVQIADGLAAAHRHGIIHRDIKPGNVLLEDGVERVKISDFGLALVTMDLTHLTSAGQTVGTPGYMSPEQVTGKKIDARNDLFGLGCVMYAMVTGSSPFRGTHPMEIAHRIVKHKPTPLHRKDPSVPKRFSDIVSRLLEKDPNRRFQTADEVCDMLRQQLAVARGERSDTLREMTVPSRRSKRRRWIPAAVVLGGLLLVAGTVGKIFLANGGGPSDGEVQEAVAATVPTKVVAGESPEAPLLDELTVGQTLEAQFHSISDALRRAAPGAVVTILDDAEYRENLQIAGEAFNGLTLDSTNGARLVPPEGAPAIAVADVAELTVRGLQIESGIHQFSVQVQGECPGLVLEQLGCSQPKEGVWASIYIKEGASGTADQPICIRDCVVASYAMGVFVQGTDATAASHVEVLNNRILGSMNHVHAERAIRNVTVEGNIFVGGGVNLSLSGAERSGDIRVDNNTFLDAPAWLAVNSPESVASLIVSKNLVLGGNGVGTPHWLDDLPAGWSFQDNVWETRNATDNAGIVTAIEKVDLISRDKDDLDFLRPAVPLLNRDFGGERTDYVGALAPRSNDMHEGE